MFFKGGEHESVARFLVVIGAIIIQLSLNVQEVGDGTIISPPKKYFTRVQ